MEAIFPLKPSLGEDTRGILCLVLGWLPSRRKTWTYWKESIEKPWRWLKVWSIFHKWRGWDSWSVQLGGQQVSFHCVKILSGKSKEGRFFSGVSNQRPRDSGYKLTVNYSYSKKTLTLLWSELVRLLSLYLGDSNLTGHGPEQSVVVAPALIRAVWLNSRGPFPPPVPCDSGRWDFSELGIHSDISAS